MSSERSAYVTKAMLPPLEEYVARIAPIWSTHTLSNFGPLHAELEEALKAYLHVPYLSLCANGHLALESVFQALELKGEVITTPFTFASTTYAILRCGLTPVFCDICEENYTIDPAKIEALITEKTCAIVPVHVYGQLCRMDEIEAIAEKHGLPVIYDAAHMFGIRSRRGNPLLRGTASILSFHATKVFNTAEGGAIVTNSRDLNRKIYHNINYGFEGHEHSLWPGGNAKLSELHAAMGLCNLPHIEEEISARARAAAIYTSLLQQENSIRILAPEEDVCSNYSYFPVVFLEGAHVRDRVCCALEQENYFARKYFYPLTCDMSSMEALIAKPRVPIARKISSSILCLPIYADLAEADVRKIAKIICETIAQKASGAD